MPQTENTPPNILWPYPFSPEDWESCLRVLQHAKIEPNQVPDLEQFKTLVSGIYKEARKLKRQNTRLEHQIHDAQVIASAQRVQEELQCSGPEPINTHLYKRKFCYICKVTYHQLDTYYHRLCPDCARLNHARRAEQSDLSGRRALVTGGRVKIGYATALRLLRNQAQVWVTTRFPSQAALHFAQEPDFETWKDRLKITGLDLLKLGALERFIQEISQEWPHLDILINNAALTLWQPQAQIQSQYQEDARLRSQAEDLNLLHPLKPENISFPEKNGLSLPWHPTYKDSTQAERESKPMLTPSDLSPGLIAKPASHNSWNLELEDIPAHEMLEVTVINQIAPMMLCAQLKPLMQKSPFPHRWILNVTAIEGQFSDPLKSSRHTHTNAAKAGLNMMTRTAAKAYAQVGIFMNAVDPGWVSSDQHASREEQLGKKAEKIPPLALEDAAARICTPIYDSLKGDIVWGKLFKNYQVADW